MEGFENQRLCVVPRPLVDAALQRPVTRRLVVTDAGFFPDAEDHLRVRPEGADESILMVCTRGSGWVRTTERVGVTPGMCVLIPARLAHSYGSSTSHPWTIWWCHVRGAESRDFAVALGAEHGAATLTLRSFDRIVALFDELVSGLERGQTPAHLLAASGTAWHLLSQIAVDRALPETGTPLERAMRYLADRVDATVRVGDLADLVGLSASHLSALFRQATGGGVTAHHTALKMARARGLLDTSSLGIAEVARAVGYEDPLYFSRQFRKVHGVSPSDYRSQRKG